jgi:hypothetical protein
MSLSIKNTSACSLFTNSHHSVTSWTLYQYLILMLILILITAIAAAIIVDADVTTAYIVLQVVIQYSGYI